MILLFAGVVCTSVPAVISAADRTGKPVPIPPVTSIARSDFGMAATGSPEATEAAVDILQQGGNAIDAAVAAALMLGVADPDASGLGGMTYMVIHLADGRTLVVDGTSPTPQGVNPERLRELKEKNDLFGYALVAVPTTLAVLERARVRFGTMDMASLIAPSIEVAERGHRLSPIQIVWTNVYYDHIMTTDYLRFLAFADGETLGQVGDIVCRPDLVRTLRHIARYGVSSFYRGRIADLIEADMIGGGGFVRKSDLAALRIKEVDPLHTNYRGTDVYTVPQPGGGTPVIEALNILETYPSAFLAEDSVERHHVLIETFRIALADRGLASESVDPLRNALNPALTKEHAQRRAHQIVPGEVIPDSDLFGPVDPECAPTGESTTQVSVADRWGNVVSLTQTLGRSYGAEVATPGLGFPYNSLLESFNFDNLNVRAISRPASPAPTTWRQPSCSPPTARFWPQSVHQAATASRRLSPTSSAIWWIGKWGSRRQLRLRGFSMEGFVPTFSHPSKFSIQSPTLMSTTSRKWVTSQLNGTTTQLSRDGVCFSAAPTPSVGTQMP